jgi:hypothetical protein
MKTINNPLKMLYFSLHFSFYIIVLTGCINLVPPPPPDTISYSYTDGIASGSTSVSEGSSIITTSIKASQISATGETVVTATMSHFLSLTPGNDSLSFVFPAQTGGTPSSVKFVEYGTQYSLDISMGTQSTITVSSYGDISNHIDGSFTFYLCKDSTNLAGGCSSDTVMTMTGSFSVTRESNDSVSMP